MYELYKTVKSKDEFFSNWSDDNLAQLTSQQKDDIYSKYLIKCIVFKNANYVCENENCSTPDSELTLHHIKFQKNGGKTSVKNGAAICKSCHKAFHRGKKPLTIDGATYQLHIEQSIDWKQIRCENKILRKNNREFHGIKISWELMKQLMEFLNIVYKDYDEEQGEDD